MKDIIRLIEEVEKRDKDRYRLAEADRSRVMEAQKEGRKLDESNYRYLEHRRSGKQMRHIQEQDYKELIDVALDMEDYEWARSLERKRKILVGRMKNAENE